MSQKEEKEPKRKQLNLPEYALGFFFKFDSLKERNKFADTEEYRKLVGDVDYISTTKNVPFKKIKNP